MAKADIQLKKACAYLFNAEVANSPDILDTLDINQVKSAFRQKVKLYHPDQHLQENKKIHQRRVERFDKITASYELMRSFLEASSHPPKPKKTVEIIAIGGGKGGTGKSMLAANLAVRLAKTGHRTVAADLDLGGSNLNLYLGETCLNKKITEFINNKGVSLKDVMTPTAYGPQLIGGNSAQVGGANIKFQQKLKLLKALQTVDADYVVIDLGGDTCFNILDFFISSHHGIVVTTSDPASYMNAYGFIRACVLRRLDRIFGVESKLHNSKNEDLQKIIRKMLTCETNIKVNTLLEKIKQEHPYCMNIVLRTLEEFTPYLVVNQSRDLLETQAFVKRIKTASKSTLNTNVYHLANIPRLRAIEDSVREMVPAVASAPDGELASDLDIIIDAITGQ